MQAAIQRIRLFLPHVSVDRVVQVLSRVGGDVGQAIDVLFDEDASHDDDGMMTSTTSDKDMTGDHQGAIKDGLIMGHHPTSNLMHHLLSSPLLPSSAINHGSLPRNSPVIIHHILSSSSDDDQVDVMILDTPKVSRVQSTLSLAPPPPSSSPPSSPTNHYSSLNGANSYQTTTLDSGVTKTPIVQPKPHNSSPDTVILLSDEDDDADLMLQSSQPSSYHSTTNHMYSVEECCSGSSSGSESLPDIRKSTPSTSSSSQTHGLPRPFVDVTGVQDDRYRDDLESFLSSFRQRYSTLDSGDVGIGSGNLGDSTTTIRSAFPDHGSSSTLSDPSQLHLPIKCNHQRGLQYNLKGVITLASDDDDQDDVWDAESDAMTMSQQSTCSSIAPTCYPSALSLPRSQSEDKGKQKETSLSREEKDLAKQQREAERANKKAQREEAKAARDADRARAKAEKEIIAARDRAERAVNAIRMKPVAVQEMVVRLPRRAWKDMDIYLAMLISAGTEFIKDNDSYQDEQEWNKGSIYESLADWCDIVRWIRKVDRLWSTDQLCWSPCRPFVQEEKYVMIVMDGAEFARILDSLIDHSAISSPTNWQDVQTAISTFHAKVRSSISSTAKDVTVIYLLVDLERYYQSFSRSVASKFDAALRCAMGDATAAPGKKSSAKAVKQLSLGRKSLEAAIMFLEFQPLTLVHQTSQANINAWIFSFTTQLAVLPQVLHSAAEADDLAFGDTVRSGTSLADSWSRALQCIQGVTEAKASGIIALYPTFAALFCAYVTLGSNLRAKEDLLSNIPYAVGMGSSQSTKRIGPTMSKRIYESFFQQDPDAVLMH